MADILKHGSKYRYAKCFNCDAEFGFLEKEITRKDSGTHPDFFGETHFYAEEYMVCPECNRILYIKKVLDGKDILKDEYKICWLDKE